MALTVGDAEEILNSVFPPLITGLGVRVEGVKGASARLLLPPSDQVVRIGDMVSGQASMAVADTAMVIALASALGGFRPVGTVNLSASFMRSMRNRGVVCEATVLRLGRTIGFCRAQLREAEGTDIAVEVTASYAIPPPPAAPPPAPWQAGVSQAGP
jgi:uncharacterized protein (TIGR00369 family)